MSIGLFIGIRGGLEALGIPENLYFSLLVRVWERQPFSFSEFPIQCEKGLLPFVRLSALEPKGCALEPRSDARERLY
jgi:hypothetical protein